MPFTVSPEYARDYLEGLGLSTAEQLWCLENKRLSHIARSLVRVAQGDDRDIVTIYNDERIEDGEYPISGDLVESIFIAPEEVIEYLG